MIELLHEEINIIKPKNIIYMIGNDKNYLTVLCGLLKIESLEKIPKYSTKSSHNPLDDFLIDIADIVKNEFSFVKYACLSYHPAYLNRIRRLDEVIKTIKERIGS